MGCSKYNLDRSVIWQQTPKPLILMETGEVITMAKKKDVIQTQNPRTGRYVKIDRAAGKIIAHKRSSGPYKGVPIARKRNK
ncbi:hypothetical protein KAR91_30275 [Candidatus Pacearchaeota archaeon]|nr:hypothetical protein [Candidatus Pacearchaeota archaeon]